MSPLLAWTVGPLELIILAVVILLLFGNRIPTLMRSMGRGVVEFKKGVSGIDDDSGNDAGAVNSGSDRETAPVDARRRS